MKIYAIAGLGADKRVFEHLDLNHELIPLDWIVPLAGESLASYAQRLAQKVDTREEFGFLGVSFGGMLAVEMTKLLNPKITILIASAETKTELRWVYRLIGKTRVLPLFPKRVFDISISMAWFLFGTKNPVLKQILDETDPAFAKWAAIAITHWDNQEKINNCLKISGSKDKILPPKDQKAILIKGAQHFMIVDCAQEISAILNREIR
ncbi:MAG TPA: alpha/beta hydrolase [Saprospiraceae bacterium]|nr:alpha/beta hydrolase [Saprospiraceae bacterium]